MHHVGRVAAVTLTVLSLSACATKAPEAVPRAQLTQDEIAHEYAAETRRLELAPGDTWVAAPPELELASPDPTRPMRYEQGVGAQTAQFQWYCSWAGQALTGTDPASALDRLTEFSSMSVWEDMDSNGHYLFEGNLEDAQAGDFDALDRYVADYCAEQ